MGGGAALGGDGVDAGPGREEDADDGRVASEDGRVQGRRVEEPVAANGRTEGGKWTRWLNRFEAENETTGPPDRMSHRKRRESKQQLI